MQRASSFFRVLILVALAAPTLSAQSVRVEGVVRDPSGAVVVGASVRLQSGPHQASTSTNTDDRGLFSFSGVSAASGTISVTAHGFTAAQASWNAPGNMHLEIVLKPSAPGEQVTVSTARTGIRLSEAPGSMILLSTPDITATPALRVDDQLRQVPGFSLFRRSSSRTSNATNQGVSLRGLGGTAASRALVLEDGFPLVDAFGGWVYWDRVPTASLSEVEVFRGGASNLYGSDALGGVVQFFTRQPEAPALSTTVSYGNEKTPDLSLWTGTRLGPWDFSLSTGMFRTDGFILVPFALRGAVDTPANSENATVDLNIGHRLGNQGRIFARGSFLKEFRNNGTPIQTNDTELAEGALGVDKQLSHDDSFSFRAYGLVQAYNQKFSAVAAGRNSETLTDLQHVPEQVVGGGLQWTHLLGQHQTLLGGLDLMEVIGASDEQLFSGPNTNRNAGGRQRTIGLFGEDILRLKGWTIILAGRMDHWSNFHASQLTIPVAGSPILTTFPDRSDLAFNPRLSVLRSLNSHISLTSSIYRAFRAPTLNELYRTFRVGNILTLNNPSLNAERLTGAEAGANVNALDRKLELRGTFFWNDIVNPVENVTTNPNSSPIQRQKQNLGRTRSRGIDLDGILRLPHNLQLTAGYEFAAATVVNYPVVPPTVPLVGLDVPQVPRNSFTWGARYWNRSVLFLSVQGRLIGRQFDDDQNQFPLDRFYTMDLEIGRSLHHNVEVFVAAENITAQRYQVARTPIVNLGPPILYRIGLRLNFPAEKHF
jgi:outer membrane receptor protein involved in Fe transport